MQRKFRTKRTNQVAVALASVAIALAGVANVAHAEVQVVSPFPGLTYPVGLANGHINFAQIPVSFNIRCRTTAERLIEWSIDTIGDIGKMKVRGHASVQFTYPVKRSKNTMVFRVTAPNDCGGRKEVKFKVPSAQ